MIIDGLNTFANNASVAGPAGTAVVGDVIDTQGLGGNPLQAGGQRDVGAGEPLYVVLKVSTGIVADDPGSINVQLVSDSVDTLDNSPTIHYQTGALTTQASTPAAGLAAGDVLAIIPLPVEGSEYERYLGVRAVIATEAVSAGAIDAFITWDVSRWKAYDAKPDWS